MLLASNLLELIFSLLVAVASLLGALFIIGFLVVEPQNEFDDDDHLGADDFIISSPPPGKKLANMHMNKRF